MSIDYELYDRQIRTFGIDPTLRIISSSIAIIGLDKGLGTEIAKNLTLSGIKYLHLYDSFPVCESDLYTGYYYSTNDFGVIRCYALKRKILELKSDIIISCNEYRNLQKSDVIICINQSYEKIIKINNLCRENNIKFINLQSSNNKGLLFIDVGDNYTFSNITGENYESIQVLSCDRDLNFITNEHNFQSGDTIKFCNLQGSNIEILNNEFIITVHNRKSFKLNVDFTIPNNFEFINGTVIYINKNITINHQDYKTQIINPTMNYLSDPSLINNYVHSDIEIMPVNSIMGSITASEAIKLVSKIYKPITQWFTWTDSYLNYDLIKNKLNNTEFFIIGSGAIGCELLKNLSFLNVKKIIITDSDIIEKSNLLNQFLFRQDDIGKLKSEIASKKIKEMNSTIEINYFSENINSNNNFLDKILKTEKITAIFNAVDDIDTRKFIDSKCFNYNIPLFDSGTMGNKGHTQSIIPFLTETYSNSNDPLTDKSFAVCTIKNFPNDIQHTIYWALEQFEFFNRAPKNINIWLNDKNMIFEENIESLQINKDVWLFTTKYENNFNNYVIWAIDMFYEFFNFEIIELLNNFPSDKLNSDNKLFWSGGKRCPHIINLDINNKLHMNFIISTIAILCNITNLPFNYDINTIIDIINNYQVNKNTNINKLLEINKNTNINKCIPQIFNKNNISNYHMIWINAVSNIRALNYSIEPADYYTTNGIANKIIPSIITTNSIVAGLITIEMIKYLNYNDINIFKSSFINLALNIFVSASPIKSKTINIADQDFNEWFKFIEKEDLILSDFLNKYNKLFKTTITMISLDNILIYTDFMNNDTNKKFSDFINEYYNIKKDEYILSLLCDNNDIELPNIILYN
jgi:ubiquitin-activating enzyme E1